MWEPLLKICLDLASYPDEARLAMIHSMPILLTRNVQEELQRAARDLPSDQAATVAPVLEKLSELQAYYQAQRDEYPIGLGPIEKIFQLVQIGEISQEQAEEQAAQPIVATVLGPLYVHALSAHDLKMARAGQWRNAALMRSCFCGRFTPSSSRGAWVTLSSPPYSTGSRSFISMSSSYPTLDFSATRLKKVKPLSPRHKRPETPSLSAM